ncbi:hypothetical protein DQ04_20251000 [Trypanosoma grayi]|uniref:hypothetical protein n=1 Tax=Trypanosoma grayi TaxID=71804 RepID=UPI0004F48A32|nr:hypothetical protein DQ04_20251000 [Trypanosoma grayi]KEG05583.1 hypothetical protein DQ04_20251000 [Trypanosoma grayi]
MMLKTKFAKSTKDEPFGRKERGNRSCASTKKHGPTPNSNAAMKTAMPVIATPFFTFVSATSGYTGMPHRNKHATEAASEAPRNSCRIVKNEASGIATRDVTKFQSITTKLPTRASIPKLLMIVGA